MEPFSHDISHLFKQLGMQSSQEFIEEFIATHHLSTSEQLSDASFLHPAQKRFIKEAKEQDADWCEVIDQLDALLRK
ncbi:TPA: DUF2789 family protein [Photobacterium damselae]